MNSIGGYSISDEEEQQQRTYPFVNTDTFLVHLDPIVTLNRTNLTDKNQDDLRLIYKINFGVICACLCVLTITGNLLVLIIFRRIRTVSLFFKQNSTDNNLENRRFSTIYLLIDLGRQSVHIKFGYC